MEKKKTKTIMNIENRMDGLDASSMRYKGLEAARDFKTSWIGLGQVLYSVWKDKLYKEWGYQEFDNYASKEIGINKQTALKLLRSYSFLEDKAPRYLDRGHNEQAEAGTLPTYESVDILRQVSRAADIDREDYQKIKKNVLEDGADAKDTKKRLYELRKRQRELDGEDTTEKKMKTAVKRYVGILKALNVELKGSKTLSRGIIKEAESLIRKLEDELS